MATDSTRRLHHHTPPWVRPDAVFHVRGRVLRDAVGANLAEPKTATALLQSARFYHEHCSWFCHLFLLMLDRWYALLSFPPDGAMRTVVGKWKSWQKRTLKIEWQDNFFDHRIRDRHEFDLKAAYIRQNPVVKGLCGRPEDWPWGISNSGF